MKKTMIKYTTREKWKGDVRPKYNKMKTSYRESLCVNNKNHPSLETYSKLRIYVY